jgi:hypothetical protein
MSPELLDGLTISLFVAIASCILCPLLCWILPNRSVEPDQA